MPHITTPDAEEILDKPFPVLDHGFVRLVDYMGSDSRVAASARVSYQLGTKSIRDDERLIAYMMSHGHTSPFEQVVMTFHVKLPLFVARQIVRHRTARLNEVSGRYSVLPDDFYIPETFQYQDTKNRQCSKGALPEDGQQVCRDLVLRSSRKAYKNYQQLLANGVSRETARIVLPLNIYTEWSWQMDLNNMFKFLRERLAPGAQGETRKYAEAKAEIVKRVAPFCWSAFSELVLGHDTEG